VTTPPRATPKVPPRSARAVGASFAPISTPKPPVRPKDPVKLLEGLLERVRAARRK
jgi:hypothetical protein